MCRIITYMNENRVVYRLDDSVLAELVKLFQLAIFTQTDISDYMRQIVLEPAREKVGNLVLTPEYKEKAARDVQRLLDQALEAEKVASRVTDKSVKH